MSTAGSETTGVHYNIDSDQNCNIKSEESVAVVGKNDALPVEPLQLGHTAPATRKGSFVITEILHNDEELDDTEGTLHSSSPVDQSAAAEMAESPKTAPSSDDSLSWASPPVLSGMSPIDSYSRFRIVKIESRDRWHRGRWTCHDFADPPEHLKSEQMVEDDSGVGSLSRNGPSIYYIPGVQDALRSPFGIVYSTGGHPVLEATLMPSSPKYARGSQFFCGSPTVVDASNKKQQTEMTGVSFSSQRISSVNRPELVSHSAARKLFGNMITPLKISVSEPVEIDAEDTRVNELFVARQLSSNLLTTADAVQKATGQTSPLDVMMSAKLGSSASEPDMRSVPISSLF